MNSITLFPSQTSDAQQRDGASILIDRLSRHAPLDGAAVATLKALPWQIAEVGTSRSARVFDGLRDRMLVVLSGVMYRHAIVRSGARQVVSLHLTGEIVGLEQVPPGNTGLGAHGPAQVAVFEPAAWRAAMMRHASIRDAVYSEIQTSLAVSRAWLTNNCRREAATRVAHLLCEVAQRTGVAALPRLTQEFLSDCVGLTSVHTNRVLRRLEAMNCLRRDGDRYRIVDTHRMSEFAEFDAGYLTPVPVIA
ncbi:Crp/Fnr family transcriptional regulator [Sphingomonas floccifaciens]|uniref:Crp/Fnr family transcriptional regulator n=1 Tax=Sphingomonas floccifaciens TaxID=1844115 RepID=A0ABW4NAN2_9SPHN